MEQEDTCSKYYNIIARAAIKKSCGSQVVTSVTLNPQLPHYCLSELHYSEADRVQFYP